MAGAPPLYEGPQRLTDVWSLTLPFPMARRIDQGSLVYWHSPRRITFWLNAYDGRGGSDRKTLAEIKNDRPPKRSTKSRRDRPAFFATPIGWQSSRVAAP